MRFDDSLKTILAADMATDFGAQSAWRQLVDLMGRGRAVVDEPAVARLRSLRRAVPVEVRAASARALAFAKPDAALVGFFAEDALAIAAPVLRTATLEPEEWLAILPRLTPASRSVLRHRRDLPGSVQRGLQSFGAVDFVLPQPDMPVEATVETADVEPATVEPMIADPVKVDQPRADILEPAPAKAPSPQLFGAPLSETPFMALGAVARGLPFVAEAFRHAKLAEAEPPVVEPDGPPQADRFEISDLVARIEAFNRDRTVEAATPIPAAADVEGFRYETDSQGIIRMVDGVARSALVGVSLAYAARQGEAHLDGVAAGAFRSRSRFTDARLEVGGLSDAFGSWRVSGVPAFEHASGRFIGFRGTARRPRRDETATPVRASSPVSDSLRQLVHELRTPTNAIAGFAELIETQLLGPVSTTYRDRATAIRTQAGDLLSAIDDLDTAARIEGHALDLRQTTVPVRPLLDRVTKDLAPLATLRGASLSVAMPAGDCEILGDDRAVERLVGRLLAALVSAGRKGEQLGIVVRPVADTVTIAFDRPAALAAHATDVLLSIDAEQEGDDGAPLLGTGFALRLAQNLAVELGGVLAIGVDRLTLQLPAAEAADRPDAEHVADEQR
ncbi:MAG TPA: HAMP domain-containing sensor histidine kinase [Sphingomonas sp.]|nr:HAMP domain-containing sensor histidine kinase [Sphingomonas sp.]